MKTKKLLFGLIVMDTRLYNILYTLFCVIIILEVLVSFAMSAAALNMELGLLEGENRLLYHLISINSACVLLFIGHKLFNKRNYL